MNYYKSLYDITASRLLYANHTETDCENTYEEDVKAMKEDIKTAKNVIDYYADK